MCKNTCNTLNRMQINDKNEIMIQCKHYEDIFQDVKI